MDKAKKAWIKGRAPWIAVIILFLGAAYLYFDTDSQKAMRDDERQARLSSEQEARELRNRVSSLQSNLDAVNLQLKAKLQAGLPTTTQSAPGTSGLGGYLNRLMQDYGLDHRRLLLGMDPEYPDFRNKNALLGYMNGKSPDLLYKISNHAQDAWLLAYDLPDALRFIYLDEDTGLGYVVANSHEVSYTGNSGGVWFPIDFTKDDRKLVMCSAMGDPGAGGSGVGYGCDLLPLKPLDGRNFYLWQNEEELTGMTLDPKFSYDQMGKTVYTTQGDKTPHHSQPGPGTPSVIMYRNLVTGSSRALLEEPDTTYELKAMDEGTGELSFVATKYRYPAGCVRGDGGPKDEALDCAEVASTSTRILKLP